MFTKNISEDIVKLNLEQKQCNDLSPFVQRKQIFDNFMIDLPDKSKNTVHI